LTREPESMGPVRVAMVVANDISTDTRVRKMAHDLASAGLSVTLIGISPTGRREEFSLGDARVLRIPVGETLRVRKELLGRMTNRHQISYEIRLRRKRYFAYQRDVAARIGWLRSDYFSARSQRNEEANRRARVRLEELAESHNSRSARMAELRDSKSPAAKLGRRIVSAQDRLIVAAARRIRESRKRRQARRERRFEKDFKGSERAMNRRLDRRYRRFRNAEEKLGGRLIESVESGDSASWRRGLPELQDYESAFAPVLDSLRPDVIHAQDVHLLGVAARAKSRARVAGFDTRLLYDAHEYIQGLAPPRPVRAWSSLEAEYIRRADAVVTVAPAIAELLQRDFDLPRLPAVVRNIPSVVPGGLKSLRREIGLLDSQLLLVYSGGLDATRGVHTLVSALAQLPEAHLALVSRADTVYTRHLQEMAEAGGYGDRLHFAPFVEPQEVVGYLSSADIGVHTIVSGPINHEVTLPNKVFEYMHARLPIVISDCKAMSEFVEHVGVGRAFRSEDVDSLVAVLKDVIAHRDKYESRYEDPSVLREHSWTSERQKLFAVYRQLLDSEAFEQEPQGEELPSLVSTGK
jgi:glycogen(starch) synthase